METTKLTDEQMLKLVPLLVKCGIIKSNSEGRTMLKQNGLKATLISFPKNGDNG